MYYYQNMILWESNILCSVFLVFSEKEWYNKRKGRKIASGSALGKNRRGLTLPGQCGIIKHKLWMNIPIFGSNRFYMNGEDAYGT